VSKSAFLDVALNQSANAVDLTIAQKESGENPGNPVVRTRAIRAVKTQVTLAVKIRAHRR
jgi:hypothetical protein